MISYDKQLSNAKAWSQTVVCEALDPSISLHTIITYYLIVWPASLIQYALSLAVHTGLEFCLIYLSTIEF